MNKLPKWLPTLFKTTQTGAIQSWQMIVDGNTYYSIEGQVGGVLTQNKPTVCSGKNIGRANQTDGDSQALAEATAKWTKKVEKGFTENIDNASDGPDYFSPMLAHKYNDHKSKVKFPALVSRKIDGCLSYDTIIEFENGTKYHIGEIVRNKIQGKVKSYNIDSGKVEFSNILNYMEDLDDINENSTQWYEIETENGTKLKVTGNHRIFIPELNCWRRVDELGGNEYLLEEN